MEPASVRVDRAFYGTSGTCGQGQAQAAEPWEGTRQEPSGPATNLARSLSQGQRGPSGGCYGGEVVLVGMEHKFEIWPAAIWQKLYQGLAKNFEQTMAAVAALDED